ncbi:MAG: hypothetical protein Q7T03_08255, partial [Deltaproteobacteria bacterium]|nr:hypothetical protein [Deltaproteobacteria bacterium]
KSAQARHSPRGILNLAGRGSEVLILGASPKSITSFLANTREILSVSVHKYSFFLADLGMTIAKKFV